MGIPFSLECAPLPSQAVPTLLCESIPLCHWTDSIPPGRPNSRGKASLRAFLRFLCTQSGGHRAEGTLIDGVAELSDATAAIGPLGRPLDECPVAICE